jgi:putative MATE family efflux protein
MIFGMLGMMIYNLIDTYYVSMLGTNELAALSFTYPVVLIVNSISLGIGMGTTSVVARAMGEDRFDLVVRRSTDSLILGLVLSVIFSIIGVATIRPVFHLLGAEGDILEIIVSYMRIWFIGSAFVVVPMIGNSVLRALGDTKTPSYVMLFSALTNALLDPVLIFGLGPFPRLEVPGAAIATVIARMITFVAALYLLVHRERVISFKAVAVRDLAASFKGILYIGAPNAFIRMVQPFGTGIITALLATIGVEAVAGFGIAAKLERFAIIITAALAVVMIPYIGQNYGARAYGRIREGLRASYRIIAISSSVIYLVLYFSAPFIGGLFSRDSEVIRVFVMYARIVPLFYGIYGIQLMGNSFFNAVNAPFVAASITVLQMFIVFIPLAYFFRGIFGYAGVFFALGLSFLITGVVAYAMMLRRMDSWTGEEEPTPTRR